jgi:fructose/tagatose bisphosphate aldolase
VSSLREEFDFPIFLNADHTHSLTIVHINTELRLTWRHGLEDGLHQREDAIVPYKVLPSAVASVQQVVSSRLKLFTNPVAEIHAQRN